MRAGITVVADISDEDMPDSVDKLEVKRFKGVFGTVRTKAYRRYTPPAYPVPDTSVSSVWRQYRYRKLR